MSVNQKRHSPKTSISQSAKSSALACEALNQRLQRLSDEVLPPIPYILTFPTEAPFHIGSRTANNWAVGHDRPFRAEEQKLQYMTFLARDTDSLLVAIGDWSDETGLIMADRSAVAGTAESSKDTGAKKKISLKDYKDQKTSGAVTSPMGPDVGNHCASGLTRPDGKARPTSSDLPKDFSKPEDSQVAPKSHMPRSPNKAGSKRPSGSERELLDPRGIQEPKQHPLKKPRLSPEKETPRESKPSKPHSPKIPALLSPTLPPTTSTGPRLPRLLSPTLPPDIERELASLKDHSPPRNNRSNVAEKSLPVQDASHREHTRDSARANPPKAQLVTKLRYGRANRKRVEALLKFNGKRKGHRSASPISHDVDREDLSRSKKKGTDIRPPRIEGTKKPEAENQVASREGRVKESKNLPEKPRTPVSQPPLVPHSAAHDKSKTSIITPGKELKPPSRQHKLAENDSKSSSHPTNERPSVDSRPIAKSSTVQTDAHKRHDRQVWSDEWHKFTNMGRDLKHAAMRYTQHGASVTDEKLAAVTAIEALLSFILAFVAQDQTRMLKGQVGDSSAWLSILAYWRAVRKNTAQFPALNNLCLLLGAVSFGAIHALDLERLAVIAIPGEHTPIPTPASDGNAVLPDEKKSKKEFSDLKVRLLDSYKDSQKLWSEGTRGLSEDVLEREFPMSWSRRSRDYSKRGRSSLKAGDYSGGYFLPFSGLTPPLEVVRFSWSLLGEWCSKERVEWNGRLGL